MPIIVSIFIPGNIQPFERGEKFADPLQTALDHQNLGEVFEEGSHLAEVAGEVVIQGCEIRIELKNRRKGLALIRQILLSANAPPETTITMAGKSESVFTLGGTDLEVL